MLTLRYQRKIHAYEKVSYVIRRPINLGVCYTSCEAPEGSIADRSAQIEMDRKSFEVSSYEVYDHDTQANTDIVAANDHVYLTSRTVSCT